MVEQKLVTSRDVEELPPHDMTLRTFRTPKLSADKSKARQKFPYYAGYSEAFTADFLEHVGKNSGIVLDPWNGSGTTTSVASRIGMQSVGFDLNPVMCVVAKGRQATADQIDQAIGLWVQISASAQGSSSAAADDPLGIHFGKKSAGFLRTLVSEIFERVDYLDSLADVSELATNLDNAKSVLLVFIFTEIKLALNIGKASNPTWTKTAPPARRMSINTLKFSDQILSRLREYRTERTALLFQDPTPSKSVIACANAENLPLPNGAIDIVLTSPPYCTRIDYAVATLVELTILGIHPNTVNASLRRELLGTTAIRGISADPRQEWGGHCNELLDFVREHPSHGSKGYYYKNLLQYFFSLFISIKEISRVLKINGVAALVVQSSYYKERQIELANIVIEMADCVGMRLERRVNFPTRTSRARINSKSSRYRSKEVEVEELVVVRRI